MIEKFIKQLPVTMPIPSMYSITKQHFPCSKSRFYYLHRKIWNSEKTFKEMVEEYDKKRYETRMFPYPLTGKEIPSLYVCSSPKMIKDF